MDKMRRRPPLSIRAVAVAAVTVALILIAAIALLVWPLALIPVNSAAARLDALRTALAIGAGAAGAATLVLAGRRQVHIEEASAAIEADALERRITELQLKAVE
jgi:hypothetical protein